MQIDWVSSTTCVSSSWIAVTVTKPRARSSSQAHSAAERFGDKRVTLPGSAASGQISSSSERAERRQYRSDRGNAGSNKRNVATDCAVTRP